MSEIKTTTVTNGANGNSITIHDTTSRGELRITDGTTEMKGDGIVSGQWYPAKESLTAVDESYVTKWEQYNGLVPTTETKEQRRKQEIEDAAQREADGIEFRAAVAKRTTEILHERKAIRERAGMADEPVVPKQ